MELIELKPGTIVNLDKVVAIRKDNNNCVTVYLLSGDKITLSDTTVDAVVKLLQGEK